MLRKLIIVLMVAATGVASADAAPRHRRPVIVVRPHHPSALAAPTTVDWNDPLRWRPPTLGEARASLRWVRQCSDGYSLEPRPGGTVLTPHLYCRWARR